MTTTCTKSHLTIPPVYVKNPVWTPTSYVPCYTPNGVAQPNTQAITDVCGQNGGCGLVINGSFTCVGAADYQAKLLQQWPGTCVVDGDLVINTTDPSTFNPYIGSTRENPNCQHGIIGALYTNGGPTYGGTVNTTLICSANGYPVGTANYTEITIAKSTNTSVKHTTYGSAVLLMLLLGMSCIITSV